VAHLRRSRAAAALDDAPSAPCPHCDRTTKTVQGVCADCWGVKDPNAAIDFRPPPRTEPLLDLESDLDDLLGLNPRYLIGIVLGVLLLFAALVLGVR